MEHKTVHARFRFTIVMLSMLSGCASWEGKFSGSTDADIGIFADQTIAIITDPDLGLPARESIYVREYIVDSEPEEKEFYTLVKNLDLKLLRLAKYSVGLVDIAETGKSEAEKVEKYAGFLKEMQHKAEEAAGLQPGHYDNVIATIRSQEKFLEALQQAQPIIYSAGRSYQALLDDIDKAARVLGAKIEIKIDRRFATVIAYQKALEEEKYAILIALGQIYQTRKGKPEAFRALRGGDTVRKKSLLPKGDPTEDDLTAIAEHLLKRLDITHKIWQEVEPDWELYRATHRELDAMDVKLKNRLNRTRAIVITWARAHQKMASGKTNPAEWFDLDSAPAQLFQLGTKALF